MTSVLYNSKVTIEASAIAATSSSDLASTRSRSLINDVLQFLISPNFINEHLQHFIEIAEAYCMKCSIENVNLKYNVTIKDKDN